MVRLESVSKSFGAKEVIRELSLQVEPGERFILLGRSGCGKTTLLRMIAGFEAPDRGSILIGGEEVGPLPVERRPVGIIFQNYALFPHMTVYDNIAVGPRIRHVPESETEKQIGELLEVTRLTELRGAYPERLSGGEAQRVALARAIINQPKILLLDEPLSALDPALRQSLREELVEIQKTLGITFLFVTHDQEEAMSLATRMGILEEGRLLQTGTPEELYDSPNSPFVAEFLGDINRLSGTVEEQSGTRVTVSIGMAGTIRGESGTEYSKGQQVTCFIRPEKIYFGGARKGGHNTLEGILQGEAFFGSFTRYRVELKNGQTITVTQPHGQRGDGTPVGRKGDAVRLGFAPEDVKLFDVHTV